MRRNQSVFHSTWLTKSALDYCLSRLIPAASKHSLPDEGALILARATHDPERDLIGGFNGLTVLAPSWHLRE
jgi:hypothetical protein